MAECETLEGALVRTITIPEITDLVADLAEIGLDRALDDGLFRDVPVLGSILAIVRTGRTIRDHLFVKKLARFLVAAGAVPADERSRFVESLESEHERRRVGETLMLLLDRLDDFDKAQLLGGLFGAYIRGEVNFEQFRVLGVALDRVPTGYLPMLHKFYEGPEPDVRQWDMDVLQQFAIAGVVRIESFGVVGGQGLTYKRNDLGKLFVGLLRPRAA